jgi:photosystem II stability/assembly factor-like uncharacterized protein
MVIRKGWAVGVLLPICFACGGGPPSRSAALPPAPAPVEAGGAALRVETPSPIVARTLPPPTTGPVAFRCDDGSARSPDHPAPTSAAPSARAHPPVVNPDARAKATTVPWLRLTPPVSVGAPDIQELAALRETLVAAGTGVHVSVDAGKTFVDASENVERTRGYPAQVYDLTVAGDELLAVSETALYRSFDHGRRWIRCSSAPPHPDPKLAMREKRHVTYGAGVAYASIGSRLFTSVDTGKSWVAAPAGKRGFVPDGLVASDRGLYAWSGGNIGALHRSTDHGVTWTYIVGALSLREGEGITTVATANGKLYVSTMLGGLLESKDGGGTWVRRWLGAGPDYQAPRPYRLWGVGGDLLLDAGLGLLRLEKTGKPVQVVARRPLGVAVRDQDVFLLSADYLSRSTNGGRTFEDARFAGLVNDSVQKVAAAGKNIGIIAAGPTVFLSVDGGATFQRGPEVIGHPQVAAVADGIYVSTAKGDGAVVLFQPASGGPVRQVGAGESFGKVPPALLAADGQALLLYVWGRDKYLLSRDGGGTFTALPSPDLPYADRNPGLLRGDEIIVAPSGYPYRSRSGAPFESLQRVLGPKRKAPQASFLHADGTTTYIVGPDDVIAWNTKTNEMTSLAKKIPRKHEQREWIHAAVVHDKTILVQIRGNTRTQLYLSRDRGASYQEVDGPEGWQIESLAPSDAGILAAGQGVWLLAVPGR